MEFTLVGHNTTLNTFTFQWWFIAHIYFIYTIRPWILPWPNIAKSSLIHDFSSSSHAAVLHKHKDKVQLVKEHTLLIPRTNTLMGGNWQKMKKSIPDMSLPWNL